MISETKVFVVIVVVCTSEYRGRGEKPIVPTFHIKNQFLNYVYIMSVPVEKGVKEEMILST